MDAARHSLLARVVSFMLIHVCLQHLRVKRRLFRISLHVPYTYDIRWLTNEVANGAPITIASFEYDIWQGQIIAYNVLIHTPKQDEWNWSSPIIARVGRVYIQVNVVTWVVEVVRAWSFEEPPIDIYTIEVADVQAFLERHDQVFNFYLLDPSIILPDPPMT